MEIPDLSTEEGLDFLDKYFKDKSYCFGFNPSKADALIWDELRKAPSEKHENLLRWYKHIGSYGSERNVFPNPNNDIELHFAKKEKEAKKPAEVKQRTGKINSWFISFMFDIVQFLCAFSSQ